jgi:hypothetical protein
MSRILSVEVCSLNDIMLLLSGCIYIQDTHFHGKYSKLLLPQILELDMRVKEFSQLFRDN